MQRVGNSISQISLCMVCLVFPICMTLFLLLWMQFSINTGYITVSRKKHFREVYTT